MRPVVGATLAAILTGCGNPAGTVNHQQAVAEQSPAATRAPATEPPPAKIATAADPTVLTANGFGSIVIGKHPADAIGFALKDENDYDGSCCIFVSAAQPALYALVENGIIRRVTVHGDGAGPASLATANGIRVGSTEAEVRAAYVPVGAEPHEYSDPPAKNLYHGEEGEPNALRFEIGADGRVTAIHAGASPQLRYSEGCS